MIILIGINKPLLSWMERESVNKHVTVHGMKGGLVLDEMAIQVNICNKYV